MEKLHQQWDSIMGMFFFDFQNVLESYSKILEDRRDEEDKQAKKQGYDPKKYNPDSMMKQAQGSMAKSMPSMPKFSMPKF